MMTKYPIGHIRRTVSCLVILQTAFLLAGCTSKPADNNKNSLSESRMDATSNDGFVPLFNGKDFNDWELLLRNGSTSEIKKVYTIGEDGILHFFRDLPENSGSTTRINAFHGVMVTKKSYSMYHLKFEFKWGKKPVNNFHQFQYDAGVFYQIEEVKVFPIGLQYQIRYNHLEDTNHVGDFWAAGTTMQWYSEDGNTFKLPSKGGVKQPLKEGEHRAVSGASFHGLDDEWNQCEIIVMGDEYVIHKLNGSIVNMATDLRNDKGPIALEAETVEIFWKNIQIKEFEEPISMQKFLGEG
ncbi:MAG: DUF1080 domain-containing protein [Cyclobacteriaceae bacterium]